LLIIGPQIQGQTRGDTVTAQLPKPARLQRRSRLHGPIEEARGGAAISIAGQFGAVQHHRVSPSR
jgi:hypothetical protein